MKRLQEEAFHQNDIVSLEVWYKVLVSDEEHDEYQYSSSFFGPCCTNGCQYCRPNCHEQYDSSNYF